MKRIKDEGGRERSGPAALVLSHIFHGELDIEQWGRVFLSEGPFSLWTVSMITLS